METHKIILKSRPAAEPVLDNFELVKESLPVINENELLLKAKYVSVDPYMRGRMNNVKTYVDPYEVGQAINGDIVAEVEQSKSKDFNEGDLVVGNLPWQEYINASENSIKKIEKDDIPPSLYLSLFGMTGLTAYFGLLDIGKPKKKETVIITSAAGAVGSVAGQISKIKKCKVIGITGSDEKVDYLKTELDFDNAFNYKSSSNIRKEIKNCWQEGVDIFFDNVGGELSDSIMYLINNFARIIVCGQISQYNQSRLAMGPRMQMFLLTRRALMQGFIVNDYMNKFDTALNELKQWFKEGKLKYRETIIEGFENLPEAFLGLFKGDNIGKLLVKV
ncbi:NADP-dependent oxidoreductase [Bacteroidota bacterium]